MNIARNEKPDSFLPGKLPVQTGIRGVAKNAPFAITTCFTHQIMPKKTSKKKVQTSAAKNRGGARKGAGRPVGSGKYGCPTVAVRVPAHLVDDVKAYALKKVKSERKGK